MNRTTFSTTMFEWTHGKKPRGYGWWWFQNERTNEMVQVVGTYSAAKRECAQSNPGQSFTVCP